MSQPRTIRVSDMTGKEYVFTDEYLLYGDVKDALHPQLDTKPLRRQLVLASSSYAIIEDDTPLPQYDLKLYLLIKEPEWTSKQQEAVVTASCSCVVFRDILPGDIEAFVWGLDHNEFIRSLYVYMNINPIIHIIRQSTFLRRLFIENTAINISSLSDALRENKTIDELTLQNVLFNDKNIQDFSDMISENTTLRYLKMSHVNDNGAISLAESLGINTSLHTLDLSQNNITDDGAMSLAESLKINTTLIRLYLSDNEITDDGAISLAESLGINTSIRRLHLSHNLITDDGAIAFAESLGINTSVLTLNLARNRISDEGAIVLDDSLRKNTSIVKLNLKGNRIHNKYALLSSRITT